jgi:hypothetical protein
MTQLESVLGFIEKMDIEMLDTVLNSELTYQGTSKKIFIEKLSLIFDKFKNKGDVEIELDFGKCKCPKCAIGNKKGFVLMGNNSREHLNLMIELSAESRVLDIYYCNEYGIVDDYYVPYDFEFEKEDLNIFGYNSIVLLQDERLDFMPTERYHLLSEKCTEAFEEIENGIKQSVGFEIINDWLKKYNKLEDLMIGNRYTTTIKFSRLYSNLERVQPYFLMLINAEDAIKKYNEKANLTNDELINWLIEYENLGCSSLVTFNMDFIEVEDDVKKWYLANDYNFYFSPDDFKSIIEFKKIFDSQYWNILDEHVKAFELEQDIKLEIDNCNLNYIINREVF